MDKPILKIFDNGSKVWYLNGQLHREDGPAVEDISGYKQWWLNGKFHRKDGPAIERPSGFKIWYQNGILHREDGPAVSHADGTVEYWLNGKFIAEGMIPENWDELILLYQVERIMNG
jgi:hypothetical protein